MERVVVAAQSKRLVLLSAASGFGKTTVLADAHRMLVERGEHVLWLSVTEADRDPAWLSRVLVDQLARLFGQQTKVGEDFSTLANRVVGDRPVIVMIDNWNFVESEPTNCLLERLLAEIDGLANFVVSSRSTPSFLFENLRLDGDFIGFTARDLDRCLQLHGGAGYMNGYPIARMWRAARVSRIYGGTSEIMKEVIGRSL